MSDECSGHKVLAEPKTRRILGARLVAPRADEMINLFALAMRCCLTKRDLERTLVTHSRT